MKLNVGDIIENLELRYRLPGVSDFTRGHYLVLKIRDGYLSQHLKEEDKKVYELVRCTKIGKAFKTIHPISCKSVDKDVEEGRILLTSYIGNDIVSTL